GHGARRLLRVRRLLGLPAARSCAEPRVPVGGRRTAGHDGSAVPALLRSRAVEWPRSDSEGTAVRVDEQSGQPRGGRQGELLLPRFFTDALVLEGALQIPAGRVPVFA